MLLLHIRPKTMDFHSFFFLYFGFFSFIIASSGFFAVTSLNLSKISLIIVFKCTFFSYPIIISATKRKKDIQQWFFLLKYSNAFLIFACLFFFVRNFLSIKCSLIYLLFEFHMGKFKFYCMFFLFVSFSRYLY